MGEFYLEIRENGRVLLPENLFAQDSWEKAVCWKIVDETGAYGCTPSSRFSEELFREEMDGDSWELEVVGRELVLTEEMVKAFGGKWLVLVGTFEKVELWPEDLWQNAVEDVSFAELKEIMEELEGLE